MSEINIPIVNIIQSVAILIDGNNIERSLHSMTGDDNCMINFDNLIPKLLRGRGLSRLIYFREGNQISSKLADRLLANYMGSVVPCHKSADIPLSISATQIARKVDTIIILSGDSDYVELVRHLKGEGVRIEIAAVKATTAQILIDEADHFVEINEEDSFSLGPKRSNSHKRSSASKSSSSRNKKSNASRSTNKSTDEKPETEAAKFVEKVIEDGEKKPKRAASRSSRGKQPRSNKQTDNNEAVKKKGTKSVSRKGTRKPSVKKTTASGKKSDPKKQSTRQSVAEKSDPSANQNKTSKRVATKRTPQRKLRPVDRESNDDLSY